MWHKAIWNGHPMRLELTRVGLLVELANHYTTRGAPPWYVLPRKRSELVSNGHHHDAALSARISVTLSRKLKLVTLVEGDPKSPFSMATAPRWRVRVYSIPYINPLSPRSLLYNAECKADGIRCHFLSLWYDSTRNWTPITRTID